MMTHKDAGWIDITFEEFCKGTNISPDNWIFKEQKNPRFYKCEDHVQWNQLRPKRPTQYYYDNGLGFIREFKYMPKHHEMWSRIFDRTKTPAEWSLWSTWAVCD